MSEGPSPAKFRSGGAQPAPLPSVSFLRQTPVSQMSQYTLPQVDGFAHKQRGLIEWLGREHFLVLDRLCPTCRRPLRLLQDSRRATDGYSLRCTACKHNASVRDGSFFEIFRMPLIDVMRLLVLFASNTAAARAARITGVARGAVSRLFGTVRELMMTDLDFDPVTFGADEVVEIDEALLAALRADESQRKRTTGWIFGIVSRDTGAVHLEIVPNREGDTLLDIMLAHVEQGAIVCGDDWPAYSALEDDYTLRTITKGRGAMSYWDRQLCINVHTGTIEGVWSQLRSILHVSHGFPRDYVPLVLAEFMYRKSRRNIYDLVKI